MCLGLLTMNIASFLSSFFCGRPRSTLPCCPSQYHTLLCMIAVHLSCYACWSPHATPSSTSCLPGCRSAECGLCGASCTCVPEKSAVHASQVCPPPHSGWQQIWTCWAGEGQRKGWVLIFIVNLYCVLNTLVRISHVTCG